MMSPVPPGARSPLGRGDKLPAITVPPPGPRSLALAHRLAAAEAPGVNTHFAGKPAILWEEARGANVRDVDGNVYLDLTSGFGVASIGHRHPWVVAAVARQAKLLIHGLGDVHAHPARVALAEALCALAPVDDPRVYFAASGADAVEIALKTALLATGRTALVAFTPAYHGTTLGALAAGSREEFRRPFAAHLSAHVHRLDFGCDPGQLEGLLRRARPAAVIVEPVVGREGVLPPPPGWLSTLAALCRDAGTLLIADEIFTGFGRTGSWFAVSAEGVRPDLLCCGKALGGGLPIAAVIGRSAAMAAWQTGGEALHTATFLAHPLACAAALAAIEVLRAERLVERAARLGGHLGSRLADWPRRFGCLSAIRGRGLAWGLELDSAPAATALVQGALHAGILLLAGGPEGRVAQLVPPLVMTQRQLDLSLDALAATLSAIDRRHP